MAEHLLTREIIDAYGDLTTDRNPLHVDDEFAAASQFGGIIAHGFLLLGGPLSELGDLEHPLSFECRFEAPGRPGDVLATETSDAEDGWQPFVVRTADKTLVSGRLRGGSSAGDS